MTIRKKIGGAVAGAALVAGLVVGAPIAANAATWAGPFVDGSHCQSERRLFIQEGYSVGSCTLRTGQPGYWFSYS